jgi:hypothetical protein
MNFSKNKVGGIHMDQIIYLGVSLILLILMINFIISYVGDSYDSEVLECNFFMENVDGKPKYFGSDLSEANVLFKDTVKSFCPSKEVILKENSFQNSAKLVRSCYEIIGSGEDFFGANSVDQSVCVHCGFIKVENDISEFNKKFSEILTGDKFVSLFKEDDEMFNTNSLFLSENGLSTSLNDGDYLRVIGYAYKPSIDSKNGTFTDTVTENFLLSVSKYFGEYISSAGSFLLSDSSVDGFSGVVVEPFDDYGEFDTSREVGFTSGGSSLGCDVVIIPNKNYD